MSYDLAICRFGALAPFEGPADVTLNKWADIADIEGTFSKQRDIICEHPNFLKAFEYIEDKAKAKFEISDNRCEIEFIRFNPQSLVGLDDEKPKYSGHLLCVLPTRRAVLEIEKRRWSLFARASVTACALEEQNGVPKLWWTFEGVPTDPNPEDRPTEKEVVAFITFARSLENETLEHLGKAYFGALEEVVGNGARIEHSLEDRVRLRFADSREDKYEALIEGMRYGGLDAATIASASKSERGPEYEGWQEFKQFVQDSVDASDPEIDPKQAYVNREVRVSGVDAVSARGECRDGKCVSVVGVAQWPGTRTAMDHLSVVREQRKAENTEKRLHTFSASRRLTGLMAGIEAFRLERMRDPRRQEIGPII